MQQAFYSSIDFEGPVRVSGSGFYPIRVFEGCCKENVSVL